MDILSTQSTSSIGAMYRSTNFYSSEGHQTEKQNKMQTSNLAFEKKNKSENESNESNEKHGHQLNIKTVIEELSKANKKSLFINKGIQFNIHEETNRIFVSIINKDQDNEVIKEIPPSELLDLMAKVIEQVGIFYDKKI